jgi:hypothetical protein
MAGANGVQRVTWERERVCVRACVCFLGRVCSPIQKQNFMLETFYFIITYTVYWKITEVLNFENCNLHVTEQILYLLINNEKVEDTETVFRAFSTSFLTNTENLKLHQLGRNDVFRF